MSTRHTFTPPSQYGNFYGSYEPAEYTGGILVQSSGSAIWCANSDRRILLNSKYNAPVGAKKGIIVWDPSQETWFLVEADITNIESPITIIAQNLTVPEIANQPVPPLILDPITKTPSVQSPVNVFVPGVLPTSPVATSSIPLLVSGLAVADEDFEGVYNPHTVSMALVSQRYPDTHSMFINSAQFTLYLHEDFAANTPVAGVIAYDLALRRWCLCKLSDASLTDPTVTVSDVISLGPEVVSSYINLLSLTDGNAIYNGEYIRTDVLEYVEVDGEALVAVAGGTVSSLVNAQDPTIKIMKNVTTGRWCIIIVDPDDESITSPCTTAVTYEQPEDAEPALTPEWSDDAIIEEAS